MRLDKFEMERLQSTWENRVKFNLSESSVHPMSPKELVPDAEYLERLMEMPLIYNQSNGTDELRSVIAAAYPGATLDHVEVTNGGSEANFVSIYSMLEPGDEAVIILPNYQQIWGLINSFGMKVKTVQLQEERRWAPDLAELEAAVTPRTRMIILCNPEQPHGRNPHPGGNGRDRAHRGRERRLDPGGRDLPGFRAGRPDDAHLLGQVRPRHHHERVCRRHSGSPACASAGLSLPRTSSQKPGPITTTPRSRRER